MGALPTGLLMGLFGGWLGGLLGVLALALRMLITGKYPSKTIVNLNSAEARRIGWLYLLNFLAAVAAVVVGAIIDLPTLLVPSAILSIAIMVIAGVGVPLYAKKLNAHHEQSL